jgi:hypothetical protein
MQYLGPAQLTVEEMIELDPFLNCGGPHHPVIADREEFLERYLYAQAETLFGDDTLGVPFPFPSRSIPDKPWGVTQIAYR